MSIFIGLGTTALAQQPAASMLGARVRFDLVSESADAIGLSRYNCEGTVTGATGDTVVITPQTCAIYGSVRYEVSALQIEAGERGSRARHFFYGMLIGAVAGGIIGRLRAGDDDAGYAIAVITAGGVSIGTIVGGAVGLILPAGNQWRALPHTRAVLRREKASLP